MEKYDLLTNDIKNTTDFFNEITGLFVDFNFSTGVVTLYGNNKEIVGIDSFIVKLTKEQCRDLFLKIISEELKNLSIEKDFLCRLQGDQFLIFIPEVVSLNSCEERIKAINEIFNKSYEILGKHIYVTTSIGISMYPDDGQDFEVLFRNSEAAMAMVKTNGKNQYQFFQDKISN